MNNRHTMRTFVAFLSIFCSSTHLYTARQYADIKRVRNLTGGELLIPVIVPVCCGITWKEVTTVRVLNGQTVSLTSCARQALSRDPAACDATPDVAKLKAYHKDLTFTRVEKDLLIISRTSTR